MVAEVRPEGTAIPSGAENRGKNYAANSLPSRRADQLHTALARAALARSVVTTDRRRRNRPQGYA